MNKPKLTMAQQIVQAARAYEKERTGMEAGSVSVVQSAGTLVITIHEALSLAEKTLAASSEGAAQMQHFHQQLFTKASQPLRNAIRSITGVDVAESAVVVFAMGTMVQVFLLATDIPEITWEARSH
jgi:uncharacterized protein YbcI